MNFLYLHWLRVRKYRGEFEEKFKKIIDKVKDLDNVIIFIDEIHNVIGAGGAEGAIDASNILKALSCRKRYDGYWCYNY